MCLIRTWNETGNEYNVTLRRLRVNHCCCGKAKYYTFRVAAALVIQQHAKRTPLIILPSLPCQALPHFSTLSIHGKTFGKSYWTWNACFFSTTFVWNISYPKRAERDINVHGSWRKVFIILVKSESNLNFLDRTSKNTKKMTFHESPTTGSRVVPRGRTGRQTRQS
jgi:hypothetical protein